MFKIGYQLLSSLDLSCFIFPLHSSIWCPTTVVQFHSFCFFFFFPQNPYRSEQVYFNRQAHGLPMTIYLMSVQSTGMGTCSLTCLFRISRSVWSKSQGSWWNKPESKSQAFPLLTVWFWEVANYWASFSSWGLNKKAYKCSIKPRAWCTASIQTLEALSGITVTTKSTLPMADLASQSWYVLQLGLRILSKSRF